MSTFMKKNAMPIVAFVAAVITIFFVPIDGYYLHYFETTTLMILFCVLAVVSGLKRAYVLEKVSRAAISLFGTTRNVVLALVMGIFIFDLFVANDMALITFLPLTYIVLSTTSNTKYVMFTFIMQTIAANMAGMIMPHGNPQNLFIYSYYNIPVTEFMQILLPEFFVTAVILFVVTFIAIPNTKLVLNVKDETKVNRTNAIIYIILSFMTVAGILRFVPALLPFALVLLAVVLYDRKTFLMIDFGLLLTFCFFFVFSGNMARIPQIQDFMSYAVNRNTLVAGIVSSQFISNVPTAIFLSRFTDNYEALLAAVNLGALGIMISSLASLITLKEYMKHNLGSFWRYLGMYTFINTSFFVVLVGFHLIRTSL